MNNILRFLTNPIVANWFVAIGTISLATIALIGDAYTRKIKQSDNHRFNLLVLCYLKEIYFKAWPVDTDYRLDRILDDYSRALISKEIYLTWKNSRRSNHYCKVMKKYFDLIDEDDINKIRNFRDNKILKKEIKKLCYQTGRKVQYHQFLEDLEMGIVPIDDEPSFLSDECE